MIPVLDCTTFHEENFHEFIKISLRIITVVVYALLFIAHIHTQCIYIYCAYVFTYLRVSGLFLKEKCFANIKVVSIFTTKEWLFNHEMIKIITLCQLTAITNSKENCQCTTMEWLVTICIYLEGWTYKVMEEG